MLKSDLQALGRKGEQIWSARSGKGQQVEWECIEDIRVTCKCKPVTPQRNQSWSGCREVMSITDNVYSCLSLFLHLAAPQLRWNRTLTL